MKLGVRAHDYGRMKARELSRLLRRDGFEAAQLAVPKAIAGVDSYGELTEEQADEIRRAFERDEIELAVLGCYVDLSAADEGDRKRQIETFGAALRRCERLGAGLVGTESSYGILNMEEKQRTWDKVVDGILRIVEKAEEIGVDVGIEPVAAHTLYSPEWTRKLLDKAGSPRLKVIFDPVNLLTPETAGCQEKLWRECFHAFGEEIAVLHLKDAALEEGKLLPRRLGTGIVEYGFLFEYLHENKEEICVLREELNPASAGEDVDFMRKLLKKGEGTKRDEG